MDRIIFFISLLNDVLSLAQKEEKAIIEGEISEWGLGEIQKIIIPEMKELLSHAKYGEIHFKYGKRQRMLESTYLITDSLSNLSYTTLGKSILNLQEYYRSL